MRVPDVYPWLAPYMDVLLPAALGLALLALGCAVGWMTLSYRVRRNAPVTGREGVVGKQAVARTPLQPDGLVLLDGELWHARSVAGEIAAGRQVVIVSVAGLRLEVIPVEDRTER